MRIVYTISPCSCMFMYPCFLSISPYCYVYVSKVLTLFHHTVCILCIQAFYPVSYVSGLFTLFHYTDMLCVQAFYSVSYVSELFTLFHNIYYVCLCVRICVLFHRAY